MSQDETDRISLWQLGPVDLRLHWQAPMTLLALEIVAPSVSTPDEPAMALRHLACEVLMQRLGLDDPLLEVLMPQRLALQQALAGNVTLKDNRPVEPGGVVISLPTRITT